MSDEISALGASGGPDDFASAFAVSTKVLGLTIPQSLLVRADQVIE